MKTATLLLLLCSTVFATVSTTTFSVTYTCAGGVGPFAFTFPISDPTALAVSLNGVTLPPSDYTTTPVNNNYNNGGSITLAAGVTCVAGELLVISRVTPITQTISFYDNMPIPMKTFERGLDKLTEIAQELAALGGGGGGGGTGNVTATSLTATKIPVATGTTSIGDSNLTDSGGVLTYSGGGTYSSFGPAPQLFSALPSCSSGLEGQIAPVTDSQSNTWGATITGTGGYHVLGYCNGTNWTVMAK